MFRAKKSDELFLVVDIGSGGAAVAAVECVNGGVKIISSARCTLPFEERTEDALIKGIASQVSVASKRVLNEVTAAGKSTSSIVTAYGVLRAPWVNSSSVRTGRTFTEATKIAEANIKELSDDALAKAKSMGSSTGTLIEAAVVRVELNGYPTSKPVGKIAQSIKITALVSNADNRVLSSVDEAVKGTFPGVSMAWRSNTRALTSVIKVLLADVHDYVIVDMESEATNMTAVRYGVPDEYASTPVGTRTIVRKTAPNGLPDDTLATIRMVSLDQGEGESFTKVSESLARIEPDIAHVFGEAMTKTQTGHRFPNRIVLVAHPDLVPWLSHFFSRVDFSQFTVTMQPYDVVPLSVTDIMPLLGPTVPASADLGIAIGAALVNIEQSPA